MKTPFPLVLRLAGAMVLTITMPGCSKEAKKERSLEAAMEFFKKGEFAASEIEFKNTLDSDPGNPESIKRLGMIRSGQGANFEAAGILTQAKKKLPNDDEVGVYLAKSLMALAFFPDSRKELTEVLDRSPGNGEALVLLAESSVTPEWIDECEQRIKVSGRKTTSSRLAQALLDLRRGDMDKGSALVEEALESDPGSARARALKASVLSSKNLPDEALAEMKIAADSAGARSSESIGYARMLMMGNRRDEAVAYLEKITAATPDFLPAWGVLGQIALSEKDDEAASRYFTKVLEKDPAEMATALMQAEVFVRAKEAEKSVDLLEKVASALPSRPQLDLALAKCYLLTEKSAKAAEALDRVLAVAPEATEAGRLRAQIHLQDGKTAVAITALEALHKRDPEDAASRDLLIAAYRSSGRNDEAVALLREKAAGDDQPASRVELGQLLNAQGKLGEARSIFEDAVETFGESLDAVSNLAAIDLREGKGDAALARMEDYIAKHPKSSEAQTYKAGVALGLKKLDLAEEALEKAIVLQPDNSQAYGLLLQMKGGAGQEEEALAVVERYLQVFPEDPQALLQRGYLLQQLGRNDEARAAFIALTQAKSDFAAAFNNLASLEAEFFELDSAAAHARKARSLDAAEPAIADTLGWIEWRLGNYPAALSLLTEAAMKLGDNPEVLYHLGKARSSMGQATEATEAFTKALAGNADFPQKEDALKQLEMLGAAGSGDLEGLKKRIVENPKDVMSHLQLAALLARGDKPQEAADAYQKALVANPTLPAALTAQARLYGGPLKSPDKALAAATEARKLAPRDPQVLAALGYAKLLTGEDEEAYGLLKDASNRLENDATVVFDFARAAYHLGQIPEARAAMNRVLAFDAPSSAAAEKFLLLTDAEALKQPGIAGEVDAALGTDPQNLPALMLRSSLDAAAGKNPESIYQEILKAHPRFDPARVRLAAHYMEDPGKLDQALSLANEARARMPDEPEVTRILALASYRKADFRYASQLLAELAIRRPLAADELLVLGLSQANSDQPGKARESLDAALKAGLPEAGAAEAKAALAKLDEAVAPE